MFLPLAVVTAITWITWFARKQAICTSRAGEWLAMNSRPRTVYDSWKGGSPVIEPPTLSFGSSVRWRSDQHIDLRGWAPEWWYEWVTSPCGGEGGRCIGARLVPVKADERPRSKLGAKRRRRSPHYSPLRASKTLHGPSVSMPIPCCAGLRCRSSERPTEGLVAKQ